MKTRVLSLICAVCLLLGALPSAAALSGEERRAADTLYTLGLLEQEAADLSAPAGEPVVLFRASDNPDVTSLGAKHPDCYVTDGPFLFADGEKLKMIWSSFHHGKYLVLEAESDNGSVLGNWRHLPPRFDFDGGHAMLFKRLDGTQMISLHAPNKAGLERPLFLPC